MSKELEAFEEMYNWIYCNTETTYEDDVKLDKIRKNVKQALQRLESIDNANPSEALKGLKHIKNYYVPEPCSSTTYDYLETIKQALLKLDFLEGAMDLPTYCFSIFKNRNGDEVTIMRKERYEEYQKVFEIIKEKGLPLVERDMILQSKDYNEYNIKFSWCNLKKASIQKTQEEFELLKRYIDGSKS